jgi:N-dimethylarginine dimethylaminohydrolase
MTLWDAPVISLFAAGFEPVGVGMSELLNGGGSVKCCALEVYP